MAIPPGALPPPPPSDAAAPAAPGLNAAGLPLPPPPTAATDLPPPPSPTLGGSVGLPPPPGGSPGLPPPPGGSPGLPPPPGGSPGLPPPPSGGGMALGGSAPELPQASLPPPPGAEQQRVSKQPLGGSADQANPAFMQVFAGAGAGAGAGAAAAGGPGSPNGARRTQSSLSRMERSRSGTLTLALDKDVTAAELKVMALRSQQREYMPLKTSKMYKSLRLTGKQKGDKAFKDHLAALEKGEKSTNPKLGAAKCMSLATVASETQDVVSLLIKEVSQVVLAPDQFNEPVVRAHVRKICEVLQMLLILTDQSDVQPTIRTLVQSLTGYLDVLSEHKVVDDVQVEAASTSSGQLVKTALVKRIHTQLLSVTNLSLQVTCIIRYIAHIDIDHVALVQLVATVKGFTVATRLLLSAVYTLLHIETEGIVAETEDLAAAEGGRVWDEKVPLERAHPRNAGASAGTGASAAMAALGSPVVAGNLNQLIAKLTAPSANIDSELMKVFVLGYRQFTFPRLFLSKLHDRYHAPEDYPPIAVGMVRQHVATVLQYWISTMLQDFDEHMVELVDGFLLEMQENPAIADMAKQVYSYLEERVAQRKAERIVWFATDHAPERIEVLQEGISLADLLLVDLEPMAVAEQLTLIEWNLYKQVEPNELLNQNWARDKTKHMSPNIVALIERSTRISHWIATMIVGQEDTAYRTKMIEKLIDVAVCLRQLNNFNTMMGFIAGLNMSSISRLHLAKKKVKSDKVKAFKALMATMNPEGSHKAYRAAIQGASAPAIPYIAVSLMDLTFIDEGNDATFEGGLINFEKCVMNVENITSVLRFQRAEPYPFRAKEPLYSFVAEMPLLDEKELYDISLHLEPRRDGKKEKKAAW